MIHNIPREFVEAVESAAINATRSAKSMPGMGVAVASNPSALSASAQINNGSLLKRLQALEKAVRERRSNGQIDFSLQEAEKIVADIEAFVIDVSMTGAPQVVRDAVRLQGRAGILAKFRHMFRTSSSSAVVYRQLQIGEDLHSVAAGVGMSWQDLAAFNGLDWPYIHPADDPSDPPPHTLVPGVSQIAIPARLAGVPKAILDTGSADADLGTDYLRGEGSDYVSDGNGNLATVSGAQNLSQGISGQFETPLGFYPEAPDWGAFWLLLKQGIGTWFDRDWSQVFPFRLARMLVADGRVQTPEKISLTFRGGKMRARFEARTVRGRQMAGVAVSS